MAQQLIFDLRPYSARVTPASVHSTLPIAETPYYKYCSNLSYIILPAAPDSLIDLEVYENPLASNPTGSNPWLCGKSRGKQPWGTPVKVKLLRPPRQSRGNS